MSGRIWITAPILAALLLGGCRSAAPTPTATAAVTANPKPPVGWAATVKGKNLVYPWSVVAGGVDSPATMQKAMQDDPVVLSHYQGLQPGNFQVQTLPSSRQGYVSFRIRDKIYWTRRMVTLQAGETVLTDGQTMLRGRCGNMISASPREPQAPAGVEPHEVAMDLSVPATDLEISPDIAVASPVASAELVNPKQLGENPEVISSLLPPSAQDSLPPAWVTGGSPVSGGGIAAVGNSGGGTPSSPSPSSPVAPPTVETPSPATPLTVTSTPNAPIEIAPPMVMASLLVLPETPNPLTPFAPPETYTFSPPASFYQPPAPPQTPPSISYPPTDSPSAPPNSPPASPPPPPSTPPENPQGPPPSGPPPNNPPTSDPPSFPPLEPPGVSVPEPSAWVLFALGIGGIALGSFRRKY